MSSWVLEIAIYDSDVSTEKWINFELIICLKPKTDLVSQVLSFPHLEPEHVLLSWFDLWDTVISKNYVLLNYHVDLLFQNGYTKLNLVFYCWRRAKEHRNQRTLHSLSMGIFSRLWRLNELACHSLPYPLMTTSLMFVSTEYLSVFYFQSNSRWIRWVGLRRKKRWPRDTGLYTHTAGSIQLHLPNKSGSKILKTHYHSEKLNYRNTKYMYTIRPVNRLVIFI